MSWSLSVLPLGDALLLAAASFVDLCNVGRGDELVLQGDCKPHGT